MDTGANKSFMSKSQYLHCKSFHLLPKFALKTQRIQVGNGQYMIVLFIISIIVDIHSHRFEVYTLVSKIHKHIGIVLGFKNILELEEVINSWKCCFSFLNISITCTWKKKLVLKPKGQKLIKVEACIYRLDPRLSDSKDIRQTNTEYNNVKG